MLYALKNENNKNYNEEYTTTTTTTDSAAELKILLTYCEQTVNIALNGYVAARLQYWMERLRTDLIMYALDETAQAPRPSWKYAEAILRRLEREQEIKRTDPDLYRKISQRQLERLDLPY